MQNYFNFFFFYHKYTVRHQYTIDFTVARVNFIICMKKSELEKEVLKFGDAEVPEIVPPEHSQKTVHL